MTQSLGDREICVVKLNIFSDKTYCYALVAVIYTFKHFVPFAEIDIRSVDAELTADDSGEIAFFKHYRCFIKLGKRYIFNYAVGFNIAKH